MSRPTASTITDLQLDDLHAEVDRLTAELEDAEQAADRFRRERDTAQAANERVHALAAQLDEFAENALRSNDRELYKAIASDIRTRTGSRAPVLAPADALHAALRRVHDLADRVEAGAPWADNRDDVARRIRDAATIPPGPDPAESDAELAATARVFAGLHRSAEETVIRVIDLHERWVAAGPPPLGSSINRGWDARLVELHNAIQPPADQKEN